MSDTELKLNSGIVGKRLKERTHEVTWRETTNFAAAIGEANPAYFDDTSEQGVIAPPTFPVKLTWPIMEELTRGEHDFFDMAIIPKMVHATEHLFFYRPIRPGQTITMKPEIAAVMEIPPGALCVMKTKATDEKGEKLFTEFAGALFRGVKVEGKPKGQKGLPTIPRFMEDEKKDYWTEDIELSEQLPYLYDGCTDIVFPIHTSPAFAKAVGLDGIIVQGTAVLSLAVKTLVEKECGGDPNRLQEIFCRFAHLARPKETLKMELKIKHEINEENVLRFIASNAAQKPVLDNGFARISF